MSVQSEHFAVGTFVKMVGHAPAEILSVLTCKCPKGEKALRIRYEDGSVGLVQPYALNPNGITH